MSRDKNKRRHSGLILWLIMAFIFISTIPSFADTTTYTYDDANRVIRVEAGSTGTPVIMATAGEGGSISPSGVVAVSFRGSRIFSITPNYGYHIADVKVDRTSVGAVSTYTFNNVTAAHAIDAQFAINTYQLNVSLNNPAGGVVTSAPAGINCGSECSKTYNHGSTLTLTATPGIAYNFTGWSGDCTGTGSCNFTMNSAKNVTANFEIKTFTITSSVSGMGGGTITPSGNTVLNYGSSQAYTIGSSIGYTLSDVKVDGVSVGAQSSYTFNNVTANHTIEATFTCVNLPVRIPGAAPRFFYNLQDAYNAANDGETIQAHAVTFTENLNIDRNINVTLDGGYTCTCEYIPGAGNTTSLNGKLETTAGGGTLTIKNFILTHQTYQVNKIRVVRIPNVNYPSLQAAYDVAIDGDIIQAQASNLTGSLNVNKNISVTLEGGYNSDFTGYSGSPTSLKGQIQTLPGGGTLTIKNFSLTP